MKNELNFIYVLYCFISFLFIFLVIVASNNFISKPPGTVVGIYGTSITFQWKINSLTTYRTWKYQPNDTGTYVIIAKVNAINTTYELVDISNGK